MPEQQQSAPLSRETIAEWQRDGENMAHGALTLNQQLLGRRIVALCAELAKHQPKPERNRCICTADVCFDDDCPYCSKLDPEYPCAKDTA